MEKLSLNPSGSAGEQTPAVKSIRRLALKLAFCDLETTGLDPEKHGIWQLAMILQDHGKTLEELDFKLSIFTTDSVDPKALEIGRTSIPVIQSYPEPHHIYEQLKASLALYVDPYNPADKFHFIGYNAMFDYQFLRRWFSKLGDQYFGSWFWHPPIDVMTIAAAALMSERSKMQNFRQSTVYEKLFGDPAPKAQLHSALFDVSLTMKIYQLLVEQNLDPLIEPGSIADSNLTALARQEELAKLLRDDAES
jgi:DNA polymerase III subunit epsilon